MPLIDLVDLTLRVVDDVNRADLRRRLEQTRGRLLNPEIRVIVVGEFKQGKSRLINALVGAPVCPVDDDIATSVPTVVRHGDAPAAFIVKVRENGEGVASTEKIAVPLESIAAHVSEQGNPGNKEGYASAEVHLPRKLLAGGLALIDSPGVGGLDSPHALTTMTALPSADAMLFVSDASQEFTEPEMQFLRQALRITPTVACVLSKTDLYPQWREVAELNRGHLARWGFGDVPLICTSSQLRLQAAELNDPELNDESGFPELIDYVHRRVLGQAQLVQQRSVSLDVLSVTEQVRLAMQSELSALTDPTKTPAVIAELEAAKSRTDELRRRSSRWQVTLNDGVADLMSDVEHDLRERMRTIQREAEDAIDKGDPAPVWDQLVDWLEQRFASAVSDTFVWMNERSTWLSAQVARHFAEDAVPLPSVRVDDTDEVLDAVEFIPELDDGHLGSLQKVLIGMRGSYGGVLMFGLLTGIIGLSLINPFSLAAGVLIGGKSYRDDKLARLKHRQAEAKMLVRRQLDDVVFHAGKQLKDRLRMVQRATRDHFTELADEQHRSLTESVLAAQKAATLFTRERDERITALKAGIARVDHVRSQVPSRPAERAIERVAAPEPAVVRS